MCVGGDSVLISGIPPVKSLLNPHCDTFSPLQIADSDEQFVFSLIQDGAGDEQQPQLQPQLTTAADPLLASAPTQLKQEPTEPTEGNIC